MDYEIIDSKKLKNEFQHYRKAHIKIEEWDKRDFSFNRFDDCLIEVTSIGTIHFTSCHFNNCKIFIPRRSYYFIMQCFLNNTTIEAENITIKRSKIGGGALNIKEKIHAIHSFFSMTDFCNEKMEGEFESCHFQAVESIVNCSIDSNCTFLHCSDYFTNAPSHCPIEGSFIAYKKLANNAIATLLIPEDARRTGYNGAKCRAEKALVLAIEDKSGKPIKKATNYAYQQNIITYSVGEYVFADSYNDNKYVECAGGIHFFLSKEEAKQYTP